MKENFDEIKNHIIETCDKFNTFWLQLKNNIINTENNADIVVLWHDYFNKNTDALDSLVETKLLIEELKDKLITKGEIYYELHNTRLRPLGQFYCLVS